MKLELEARLRAFAAFARRGSFSKAAEDLYISQPAVSKHIADLERDLNIQLINRKSNTVGLTEAGHYLAQSVLQAEALLSQALQGLETYQTAAQAHISLAASGTPGEYLLPPFFATFHLTHPNIQITFEIGTSDKVVEMVRQHHAEVGIIGGLATATELEVEPIFEDEIVVIGPPSLKGKSFSPRDLRHFTWVHREAGSSTRTAVEAAWKNLGIIPKARIEMPSW